MSYLNEGCSLKEGRNGHESLQQRERERDSGGNTESVKQRIQTAQRSQERESDASFMFNQKFSLFVRTRVKIRGGAYTYIILQIRLYYMIIWHSNHAEMSFQNPWMSKFSFSEKKRTVLWLVCRHFISKIQRVLSNTIIECSGIKQKLLSTCLEAWADKHGWSTTAVIAVYCSFKS